MRMAFGTVCASARRSLIGAVLNARINCGDLEDADYVAQSIQSVRCGSARQMSATEQEGGCYDYSPDPQQR